jgi:adenosine kinase
MSRIVVSGSMAYDHIMDYPDLFRNHFLPDKLHNINVSFQVPNHNQHFGGTAGNIAYNLAMLGEMPNIIATVGNDFGPYEAHLKEFHVPTDTIHRFDDASTSFAYILTDRGDNQIAAFYLGAGGRGYRKEIPIQGANLAIIAPGCVEDMHVMPGVCREAHVPFFFDPGQAIPALSEEDLRNGFEGAEVVFGNDYEFTMLYQRTGWQEADMARKAKVLIITLGELGTRVVTSNTEISVPAVRVDKLVDPTGAGDAYRAGYAKGYLAGLSPEQCARLGGTVAAFAIETVGTQEHRFTMDELKARYESAYVEKFPL